MFIGRIHGLYHQLPLWKVALSNGVVQILRSMAVVGSSHNFSFMLQQKFQSACWFPVELDICFLACFVDQLPSPEKQKTRKWSERRLCTVNCILLKRHIKSSGDLIPYLERVNTKAFHMPEIRWNSPVIKKEGKHVAALRNMREVVHNPPRLLNMVLWIWLQGMNHLGELHNQLSHV